jgi:hypothetical protein
VSVCCLIERSMSSHGYLAAQALQVVPKGKRFGPLNGGAALVPPASLSNAYRDCRTSDEPRCLPRPGADAVGFGIVAGRRRRDHFGAQRSVRGNDGGRAAPTVGAWPAAAGPGAATTARAVRTRTSHWLTFFEGQKLCRFDALLVP